MLRTRWIGFGWVAAAAVITSSAPASSVRISEVRIDQPSSDLDEFLELAGPVGAPLGGLTYIVIGDGTAANNGVIEEVTALQDQSLDENGLFVAAEATFSLGTANLITELNFENGDNVTHMLVSEFSGSAGDDLDPDDDGVLDITPWSAVVDCVALIDTAGAGDHVYCPTQLGPDGSGPPFHIYRCSPSWVWRLGARDPVGGDDTPGSENPPCPCLADLDGTGHIDALDLAELLDAWGPCVGCDADFNRDASIGAPDLAFLLESWGPCPSAPAPGMAELFDETIAVDATDQDAADRGLIVTHLYASGDQVGVGNTLLAVGFAGIDAVHAELYQEPITFVAMNLLADDDNTTVAPGLFMDATGISGDWFAIPLGGQAEAVDISAITGNPGQAGVLIAQITLIPCQAAPGNEPAQPGYAGTVTLFTSASDGGTLGGAVADLRHPACPADVDVDGAVGVIDFLELLRTWGACPCCRGDIDGDGAIGITDFLALIEDWGPCP
jgi:hypothetical protein